MASCMKNCAAPVIVVVMCHQAKEFGEAEVWMNERLMRAAPSCFARFITAFEDGNRQNTGKPVRHRTVLASLHLPTYLGISYQCE